MATVLVLEAVTLTRKTERGDRQDWKPQGKPQELPQDLVAIHPARIELATFSVLG